MSYVVIGRECGLYYIVQSAPVYLPRVDMKVHSKIISTTSRTVLTQTFTNPDQTNSIKEARYIFPLYDGCSVTGFTCQVGDRLIVGEVKEKEKAKAIYKEAVSRGETAGLFEQLPSASDVFTTTVGNIPPGARVVVNVTYLAELKHDMEVDGIRFTVPTLICPRYGDSPPSYGSNNAVNAIGTGISFVVDAEVAEGSFIQKIQSPSHPISISMGTTSSAPNDTPSMAKASATLSLGEASLDKDFVLQIVAKDTGIPKAVLETHPTIPNQRALMATLVPKFALPQEKPEVVFVCDRSGSMGGTRIELAVQALKVFLKSLPVGVKFNICSFGSHHSFLWKRSKTYSQDTLDEATAHVSGFSADYGGTEMLHPLRASINNRYKDIPLEIMLLTDGQIWDQNTLFTFLNKQIAESKVPIRVFTLGIGNGVSHALIEGIARAGNGFSQAVGEGEKMDGKVVRMLKGALSPHITDYKLEVKYSEKPDTDTENEGFELVESVTDALTVQLDLNESKTETPKKAISLFDQSADPDKEPTPTTDDTGESRYAHLPDLAVPNIIQAPQNIPTLFAFNRTTVYLLFGPKSPQMTPKSVVLRATSNHGPLELEFPVQVLETPGETIHQLAAKKAIAELEQGRGWLQEAKDKASGVLVKTKYEGRFEDMVEREAVRLGVQFQVGGKWCSFVAVEKKKKETTKNQSEKKGESVYEDMTDADEWTDVAPPYDTNTQDPILMPGQRHLYAPTPTSISMDYDSLEYKRGRPIGTRSSRRSEISSVQAQMHANINRVVERGERLDSLQTSNVDMVAQSSAFREAAEKKRKSGGGGFFQRMMGSSSEQRFAMSSARPEWKTSQEGVRDRARDRDDRASASPRDDYDARLKSLGAQNERHLHSARRTQAEVQTEGHSLSPFGSTTGHRESRQDRIAVSPPPAPPSAFSSGGLFGAPVAAAAPSSTTPFGGGNYAPYTPGNPFAAPAPPPSAPSSGTLFGGSAFSNSRGGSSTHGSLFSASAPAPPEPVAALPDESESDDEDDDEDGLAEILQEAGHSDGAEDELEAELEAKPKPSKPLFQPAPVPANEEDLLHALIALQTFSGAWKLDSRLFSLLPVSEDAAEILVAKLGEERDVVATAMVVAFFEGRLGAKREVWELVVEKARGWLGGEVGDVEAVVEGARVVFGG